MKAENRRLFRQLHILTDGLILFLSLPVAFWIRFYLLPGGVISVPLSNYMTLNLFLTLAHLLLHAFLGLQEPPETLRPGKELVRLWLAGGAMAAILLSFLFLTHEVYYSRVTLGIYFLLSTGLLTCKRVTQRFVLRQLRKKGYGRKAVLLVGSGPSAKAFLSTIGSQPHLGYYAVGLVADLPMEGENVPAHLGAFSQLAAVLEQVHPLEVVCAVEAQDYAHVPQIIAACENAGIKLSIVPFYAEYLTSVSQIDSVGGMPMLNIRRVPLDNWGNAFCKRLFDIVLSLLLILLTAPIMLVCAVGVRLSSPGPVIFRQARVGRYNKPFQMYKFRSMRVNEQEQTGWSTDRDTRKTPFGAFLRKYSLDELPQFFNVLKGDMSLVGPRPEVSHFVEKFRSEIPLYMVKHQVRPGITGWAQIHDFRGDTSIKARIEYDIDYIEHWTFPLDLKILFLTVFKGKFINSEKLR